jgi:hypothetical protein
MNIDLEKIKNSDAPKDEKKKYLYFRDRRKRRCPTCGKDFLLKCTYPKQQHCGMDCNMNKTDNRHSNLLICTNEYHRQLHHKYALRFAEMFL